MTLVNRNRQEKQIDNSTLKGNWVGCLLLARGSILFVVVGAGVIFRWYGNCRLLLGFVVLFEIVRSIKDQCGLFSPEPAETQVKRLAVLMRWGSRSESDAAGEESEE